MCQNLVSLNLAGIGVTRTEFNAYVRALASDVNFKQLSGEERTVLDQICSKEISALGDDHPATGAVVELQKRIIELS